MANEDKVLNEEEKELPSGNDQPENETSDESEETSEEEETKEETESEEGTEEETVESLKTKLAKVEEEKENYKKAFLSIKKKKKTLEKEEKEEKEEFGFDDEYGTKKELYKMNEQTAIQRVLKEVPELDANWDDVISYYAPRRGKNTVENIIADIKDAYYLWERHNKKPEKPEDEDKQAKSQLSSLRTEPTKGKERKPQPPKEHIIPPKPKPMIEWYK